MPSIIMICWGYFINGKCDSAVLSIKNDLRRLGK